MGQETDSPRIILDNLSSGLYQAQEAHKNYRINKALRVLMLRSDFISFLNNLKAEALEKQTIEPSNKKQGERFGINFKVSDKLISEYIQKVEHSDYFEKSAGSWKEGFAYIAKMVLLQTYLDSYMREKLQFDIFNDVVIFDNSVNYPNIYFGVYDKGLYDQVFTEAFYSQETKGKYGKLPGDVIIGGPTLDKIPRGMSIPSAEPKVCQIVFDDTTEKQELIDYIDKSWHEIKDQLKSSRPERKEKRIANYSNFIRDVDIYNKYQEFKSTGDTNPDVKTWKWLKNEPKYKIDIDPNTIRKIVSQLNSDIRAINSSK